MTFQKQKNKNLDLTSFLQLFLHCYFFSFLKKKPNWLFYSKISLGEIFWIDTRISFCLLEEGKRRHIAIC